MLLKICGITNLEDARYCAGAGADFLGFIQYAPSPRYLDPKTVRGIIEWLYGPLAVGVFVNEPVDTVNHIAEEARFDLVQLHGDEPPSFCAEMANPVIKALRVHPGTQPDDLRRTMDAYRDEVTYFLLDTQDDVLWGGTGQTFDWNVARSLTDTYPILLAGGLSADNVAEAVRLARPLGLDLSSSVEARPGKKDLEKLGAFFDAFRALYPAQAE